MFCILPNEHELCRFSHWVSSYKMSNDKRECVSIYYFEFHPTSSLNLKKLDDMFLWGRLKFVFCVSKVMRVMGVVVSIK